QPHLRNRMCSSILGRSVCKDEDVKAACEIMTKMPYVGITEQFDESMLLLHYTFGWTHNFETLHLNRGHYVFEPKRLTQATFERLQELTKFDQSLYEYGVSLFNQQLRQMTSES